MCGIAGIFNLKDKEISADSLKSMADVQIHRGPDDFGIWKDNFIGFSHRRLSIIDLSDKAHQPMSDFEGNIWLVFNGEIYNFIELRKELKKKGYKFKSNTDSEVVIYSYKEWGLDCTKKFNGMWSFALWDSGKRHLFCSRDRFGEKPFYYFLNDELFLFSSEVKALLEVLPCENIPNFSYLYRFLITGLFDDNSSTFFKNINQLEPAHSLLISNKLFKVWRYWDYDEEVLHKYDYFNPEVTFLELLSDSISLRLRSDVPVGTCLSGGIDSSSIVTLTTELMKKIANSSSLLDGQKLADVGKVHTFSSVYEDADCDESYYINIVRKETRSKSEFIYPKADDFFDILKKIIWHQDEPSSGPGLYSQWHVMSLANGKVKVLLDGQGADELLGGYFHYFSAYFFNLIKKAKENKWKIVKRLLKEYPEIKSLTGQDYLEGLIEILRQIILPRFLNNLLRLPKFRFKRTFYPSLYHLDFIEEVKKSPLEYTRGKRLSDELNNTLYWSLTKDSLPALLHYEDRNSMAFSIEARTPFLDYRLVEFCLGLPSEEKITGSTTKVIMRKALKGVTPQEILERRDKKGYPTPFARWIRESQAGGISEILLSKACLNRKLFNFKELEKRLQAHSEGKIDCSWEIWRWLTLELWFRIFIDKSLKV